MARDSFDESKNTKKKVTKKKTEVKKPQSSSVTKPKTTTTKADKVASKSTFLGGGAPVQKVEQAASKPTTVKKPANTKKQTVTKQEQINQKMYGTTKPNVTTKTQRTKRDTKPVTSSQRKANAEANMNLKQRNIRDTAPVQSRRTATTTAAQRQKMGMPTQQDLQDARASRREIANSVRSSVREATSETNKGFMQRQKSGTLTTSDKKRIEQTNQRRAEVARNTRDVAKKAVQDTGSGYAQSIYDLTELTAGNKNGTQAKAMKMGLDPNRDRRQIAKLEREQKYTAEESKRRRDELFQKQEQRQAEWDERTKNAKGLEKAWYGAVESGTGMVADTLVGAATGTGQFGALASMGLRTYGSSANQARKEGATDKEARLYGAAQSLKEMGTELMFQGAGLAKAAYGRGGLSLADKSANILTRGLTGLKADAVGAGVRALGGTAEENIEELAGWMADPLIKELTYGKAVRNRMKENLRANIPQIGSDADAAHVASYFSTPKFTDDLTKEYVKSGMSKDKASALAAEMRDYYVAYYSGDKGRLDALEEDLAAKLSGQDKLSFRSWSMDELKDTFASTTLLTLATGLPGAVTTSVKGNQIFDSDEVKAVFGNDAVRKVADAVKNTSNREMSLKAETMEDRLNSGKDLTGTQKYDLYQGYIEKVNETAKKARASNGVVENARQEQNLVPTMGVDRAGNTVYAKETQREYDEKYAETAVTAESLRRFMESDNSISDDEIRRTDAAIKAVSDLHVGGLTIGDAHEFAYGNNLARETLKIEEGINLDKYIVRKADGTVDLAATNEATENALFRINAENAIKAAQAETEVYIDDTRGNIDKDLLTRFGNNGQAVWKEVNKDLDPRDLKNYLTNANAASYFYSAGRNTDMSVDTAVNRFADTFKTVDKSVMKRAFAAGARDRIIANTPGYGQTVESGSNIPLKKTEPVITGQLIMDDDVVLPDSDQSAYLALAMSTNTNIHIVSNLNAMGKDGKPIINQATGLPVQLNGMSHGNDIYLNMNEASEKNLGYVFMHEMTHQIKQYAPNEYLALENLVRDKWFNKDATGMQAAIKQRMDLYSVKGGQQLTEEEAVEEIIADAMAEAMDDPNFAAEVCEQDINLGQAILDSIREALRSIRNMFASTEFKNDRFHNSLLSYLGILDEAEKMWLNALHTARQNKADGLIADWQDKANKQNAPRLSANEASNETNETRFSLNEPVERVKDLIAVHNLKADDIRNTFDLGGFPMPSIAITKDSMGHDMYGDITLMFHSDTIDPKKRRTNEVFGGDAYTPVFPRIHYKANSKIEKRLSDLYYEWSQKYGYDTVRPFYEYGQTLQDALDRAGGEAALIDQLKSDSNLMRMYLRINDNDVEDVMKITEITMPEGEVDLSKRLIDALGEEAIRSIAPEGVTGREALQYRREWVEAHKEQLEAVYRDYFISDGSLSEEDIEAVIPEIKPGEYAVAVRKALDYLRHGATTTKEEKDYEATTNAIKQAAEETGYDEWIDDLFKGVEEKRGLRNDRDMFTASGNRRKWESLYEPVTLDGVVRVMSQELSAGANGLLGANPKGASQKNYKSLDEIRADEDRLQQLPEEEYKALEEAAVQKLSDVCGNIVDSNRDEFQNRFGAVLDVGEYIAEVLNVTKNRASIQRKLHKDYNTKVSDEQMDDLMEAIDAIANLPTGYFEAKPRRAVGFDEVKAAIIPQTMDADIKAGLESRGIPFYEYVPEVDGDRTEVVNKAATEKNLRFSISEDAHVMYTPKGVEVVQNPTDSEYNSMREEILAEYPWLRGTGEPLLRKTYDESGNEYYWNAFEAMHSQVEPYINKEYNTRTSQQWKWYEKPDKDDYPTDYSALMARFSIAEDLDEPYMAAVNSGNMKEAQRLVDEAALTMPNVATTTKGRMTKPLKLYHGTNAFGFTVFDDPYHKTPFIYTSTDRTVSAHYAGDEHYAGVREIGKPYREGSNAEDVIENARYVLGSDMKLMSKDDKVARFNQVKKDVVAVADKIDKYADAWRNSEERYELDDYINNAIAWMEMPFWDVRDGDLQYDFDNDTEENKEWKENLEHDLDMYDQDREIVKDFYGDNYNSLPKDLKLYLSYLIGYEASDAVIDIRYGMLRSATNEDVLSNMNNENIVAPADLKSRMDSIKNIGSYEMFGDLGENPFEFDAGGAQWYALQVPEVDPDHYVSTDNVCKWAYEQGYTSVIMHNIRDYGDKADNYVFFNSGQLKSADPVTYAEDGSVIPLSERFNPNNNDIRYSLPTIDSDGNILTDGQMEYFKNSQARDIFGRLVPVYHATDEGGFTIFDPMRSDDYRSLFFSSRRDAANTYVEDKYLTDEDRLGSDENNDGQTGYYQVYLNLENPLIIEGHGQPWNDIVDGGSVFPAFSYVRVRNAEWYREDADDSDRMYAIGQRLRNGDDSRAKAEELSNSGLVEIEIFDGEEKHRSMISSDAESIGMEIANIFGIDDFEIVSGLAENISLDMDISNSTRFDATDMRNTIGEYGYNTREWAEFAADEGYDGVIFRNIVDIDDKTEVFDSDEEAVSDIYVAFSSNQVKDTRNENPTENPDIRYSITDEDEAMEWLASQYELDDVPLDDEQAEEGRIRMAKSKKDFIKSKNALWNERWLTEGKVINVKSVRKNIKDLVTGVMANSNTDRKYKSEVVDKTLIDAKSAYWLMKEGKHSEAAELLWNSAASMIENVDFVEDLTFNQYKDLRDYMRTTSFKLGEEYWSDVDFSAFRKRNFGRIKLVKGETNIDEIYQELQEKWPEWFDEDEQMTAPDQLLHIEEVLDAIQPYKIAYTSEEAEQLAGDIADVLYDIVYQGEEYKSIADTFKERYDAKTKALKARHEEALAKVRTRSDELLAAEKEKTSRQKERAELWKSRTFEEKAKRQKDKDVRKKAKYFGKISDNIDWLSTRLLNETKDKNIPEGFRRSLAHMLMQFDMQTERSKALEEKYGPAKKTLQMRELKNRLEKIANEDDTGEFRYDGYLFYLMDALAEKVDGQTIDALDTEDLIAIDTMLKSIVHNFRNYNKIRLEEEKVAIANIGDNIIDAMDERIKKYGKRKSYGSSIRGYLDKLVNEGEETPIYFFERLDPTGQGIGAMYKELRRGEDRHIQNMNFLRNRFKAMFSDYFNEKKPGSKLESWRDTSQAQTFNLKNGSITLNPAQIMSLYCLTKRQQAMGHILGSGIVASPISFGAKMQEKFKGKEEQVDSVMIEYSEVQEIIATLTEDQVHLADEMQALMNNEMAAWGNETSLELHGIKLFREKDYFPIKASNEVLDKSADKRDVNEKIKNFGFTKPLTRNANNAIMIDDIFSVVADHCNKMSLYNSMAIPITDFMRVYNYKQRREGEKPRAVQAAVGEAFTRKANDYIMKFISDVNGNTKTRSDAVDDLMNKTLANYKKASIGFNGRVALQQITAIFRARMVIDGKYFLGTKLISPKDQKEMFEHCPIALWKSWGHYDMDMGRDIEDIMMNNDWSKMDTVTMGVYGMLDNMAWGKIWQAVKKEIKAKHPEVQEGSDEFFRLCNVRASEIFDKTQVVDSIFHRSDVMRSKNTLTKMATSFMAEPTLTYNVFRDSIVKARELMKDGNTAEAGKLLLKMMRVLTVNAIAVGAAAAIWDVVRGKGADDDDDDENLMEKGVMALLTKLGGTDPWTKDEKNAKDLWLINFLNNFSDNAPWAQWNNIYFVKDIVSLKDGWGTSNMALEGWETLFKGVTQAKKKLTEGSDKSWYDIWMNIAGGLGYVTGYPVKTFMRDTKAILEKFGVEVFAADGSDESTSLMDSIANKMGYRPIDKKGSSEIKVKDSFLAQLGIGKTEEEKEQDAFEKKTKDIADKYADLSGEEKDKKVWSSVTTYLKEQNEDKGVADMVTNGDYATINKYRQMYLSAGGNAEYFDKRVLAESKKALKKSIKYDQTNAEIDAQNRIKSYMMDHGATEQEISEIAYKSATAKDMKIAFIINDKDAMLESLEPLVYAGLTYEDLERIWENRNRIDIMKYKSSNGRYADRLKSTGKFIWPTDGVITSHFGYRNAPTAGASSNHPAIDIGAPQGTAVVAADGGVVISAGANGGYGNSVGIKHDNGMITWYNHLYDWSVKVGDTVAQGQQIAQVGSTGISTGPHLDFKIMDTNGNPVDPEKYLATR